MSDWDDFLFYENERLANDGIPIEGDPFADPEDFEVPEEETVEEVQPQGNFRYETLDKTVYAVVLNHLIQKGFCSYSRLLLVHMGTYVNCDIVPILDSSDMKEYRQPNMQLFDIKDCVRENEKGEYLPDQEKIRKITEQFFKTH